MEKVNEGLFGSGGEPNGKKARLSLDRKEGGVEASSSGGGASADPARDTGASEGNSGGKMQEDDGKRKRYHRHSLHQIEELERAFRENPHPNEEERASLSQRLSLEPRQIKFWFQNRRTQVKSQSERNENQVLRAEKDRLIKENLYLRESLRVAQVHALQAVKGGTDAERQLQLENKRLKAEVEHLTQLVTRSLGQPPPPAGSLGTSLSLGLGLNPNAEPSLNLSVAPSASVPTLNLTPVERQLVCDLAVAAYEELKSVALGGSPLWEQTPGGRDVLNQDEYAKRHPASATGGPVGSNVEATRAEGVVMSGAASILESFMNVDQWMDQYPTIVSKAGLFDVLSTGGPDGSRDRALQLMFAETHALSPLVPTRGVNFLRYCCKIAEGMWVAVDSSVDGLRDFARKGDIRCRRRPSGLVIKDAGNGCSTVTVVEHSVVEQHALPKEYETMAQSGALFGATRWLAVIQHQATRLAATTQAGTQDSPVMTIDGRRTLFKLAKRMVTNFCIGASGAPHPSWTPISYSGPEGSATLRIQARKNTNNPGEPTGIILSASSSFYLDSSPQQVFTFLTNQRLRQQWDILSNGGLVEQVAQLSKGQTPGNALSLFKAEPPVSGQNNMLILQESVCDPFGCMLVYAPVDTPAVQLVIAGGDPDNVALLPSGFSIFPDGNPALEHALGLDSALLAGVGGEKETKGSLTTISFQILVSTSEDSQLTKDSIDTVSTLVWATLNRIKSALSVNHGVPLVT
ncbi:homeobox and START domains containing protein [Klebsormidium nitens]|uniref:Homeobox and START domains containing protein n=1 Tax=Klebsormidium nitens TaxID=105231 RepID=A0A1Y1IDL6_KLENI|nr:homeobox and START domains containing protein [Klebsormidium nitens]|eukprot:GAQ88052.1 homeobox and START domains containing protein [Klebsormidium nitens]